MTHRFHPSIIRAYDVRGIADETFGEQDCFWLGRGFATLTAEDKGIAHPKICVIRDGRVSSQRLARALAQGLKASGAHVYNAGLGPTPMGYFSAFRHGMDGVMVITGSHNPPTHNGCKIMMGERSFYGQGLTLLASRIENTALLSNRGEESEIDLMDDYVRTLIGSAGHELLARKLRIAWDAGNGAAGPVVERLVQALDLHEHGTMYTRVDGSFPNHHPDPSEPENMQALILQVEAHGCDVGLAFDGDGDRLGVVDDKGRVVSPDHLLMLFADDVLRRKPGATIIADVKTSDAFFARVKEQGGNPVMWMTGHAHIKTKMRQMGALFGGEASGHIFFADQYFGYDDGLYAALRILALIARQEKPLSALIDALPQLHGSHEIRITCPDEEKFQRIGSLQLSLEKAGATMSTIDGVRVSTPDGWWLLRASNTQPALVGRAEATNAKGLERVMKELTQALKSVGLTL